MVFTKNNDRIVLVSWDFYSRLFLLTRLWAGFNELRCAVLILSLLESANVRDN